MNLILFEPDELNRPLPRGDPRAAHIIDVLRRTTGDQFDVGLIDGPRGKATLLAITPQNLALAFAWGEPAPALPPIVLLVGLPRPQTARDLLRDATTLGVQALHFVRTERCEPGYAQSTLWSSGEWRRHVLAGAQQAFATRLPRVAVGATLSESLGALTGPGTRLALDNYEAPTRLGDFHLIGESRVALAVGPERGWSGAERELLRAHQFVFVHLGERVLRIETAVIAALALVRAKLGLM